MSAPTTIYRLVTLAEAKDQLSVLDNEDDVRIDRLTIIASQIIMNYLKVSPYLDGWTNTSGIPLVDTDGNPLRIGGQGYLDTNGNFILDLDTNGNPIDSGISVIPGMVQAATLLVIAALDDDREGAKDPLSPAVESLLMRFRDPAVA